MLVDRNKRQQKWKRREKEKCNLEQKKIISEQTK